MNIQDRNTNINTQALEKIDTSNYATETKMELKIKERTADEKAQKEFDKILRRPRSRKYMKAMKLLDNPIIMNERIIEELKKEVGVLADDDLTFTPEDIEAFKERLERTVEEEIRKEEERRKGEERKYCVEDDELQTTLTWCGFHGCPVHRISSYGNWLECFDPHAISQMGYPFQLATDLILKSQDTIVEIYKFRLVHRNENGDVIKIYHRDDNGEFA